MERVTSCAAATRGLTEIVAPGVEMILRVRRIRVLAPNSIIGRIHRAVEIEIASQRRANKWRSSVEFE
jgi:hypothetical protein